MPHASLLSSSLPVCSLLHRPNFSSSLHPSGPLISITNPTFSSPPRSLPFSTRSRDRIVSFCSPMLGAVNESAAGEKSLSQDCLSYARAYWVTRSLIAWNIVDDEAFVWLYASRKANLFLTSEGVEGEDGKVQLERESCGLPENVLHKFPHIKYYKAFHVPDSVDVRTFSNAS